MTGGSGGTQDASSFTAVHSGHRGDAQRPMLPAIGQARCARTRVAETVTQSIYVPLQLTAVSTAAAPQSARQTPTQFPHRRGSGNVIRFAVGDARSCDPVAPRPKAVLPSSFVDDPEALVRALQDRFPRRSFARRSSVLSGFVARSSGFVEASVARPDLPLDIRGPAFTTSWFEAIRAIPAGATASYRDLAKRLRSGQIRARGFTHALAANAIAAPFHATWWLLTVDRRRAIAGRCGSIALCWHLDNAA